MDDLISYPHNLLDEVTCYFAFALMQEITYPFFFCPHVCIYRIVHLLLFVVSMMQIQWLGRSQAIYEKFII